VIQVAAVGPWAAELEAAERLARIRAMRARRRVLSPASTIC
jgi:hypothetical protein